MTGDGKRGARVAAQLRQGLARLLTRDIGDPRLEGVIVARVTMSPDLRLARIYWRLATADDPNSALFRARRDETAEALGRASGRLKRAVTSQLGLRFAPDLRFAYDEGQEARDRIDELLEEVKRERR